MLDYNIEILIKLLTFLIQRLETFYFIKFFNVFTFFYLIVNVFYIIIIIIIMPRP